jgi:hypothetical protein
MTPEEQRLKILARLKEPIDYDSDKDLYEYFFGDVNMKELADELRKASSTD